MLKDRNPFSNQSGVVLVSCLILLVVGSILASSIMAMSVSETYQVQYKHKDTQAQSYAQSAVMTVYTIIEDRLNLIAQKEKDLLYAMNYNGGDNVDAIEMAKLILLDAQRSFSNEVLADSIETSSTERILRISNLNPEEDIMVHTVRKDAYTAYISANTFFEGLKGVSEVRLNLGVGEEVVYTMPDVPYYPPAPPSTDPDPNPPTIEIPPDVSLLTFNRAAVALDHFKMHLNVSISGFVDYYGSEESNPSTIRKQVNPPKNVFTNREEMYSFASKISNLQTYGSYQVSGDTIVDTSAGPVAIYAESLRFAPGARLIVRGGNPLYLLIADNGSGQPIDAPTGMNIKNEAGGKPQTYIMVTNDSGIGEINIGGSNSETNAYIYAPRHDLRIGHDDNTIGKYIGALWANNIELYRASISYVGSPELSFAIGGSTIVLPPTTPTQPDVPQTQPSEPYTVIVRRYTAGSNFITWLN